MTNSINKLTACISVCLCIFCFVSCGDDKTEEGKTPDVPIVANVTYSYKCQNDNLAVFDISITYVGADNKDVTENITQSSWSKKLESVAVPFTAKMKTHRTEKEGFTPNKDIYTFGEGDGISYTTSNGQFSDSSNGLSSLSLAKEKLDQYIKTLLDRGDITKSAEIKK